MARAETIETSRERLGHGLPVVKPVRFLKVRTAVPIGIALLLIGLIGGMFLPWGGKQTVEVRMPAAPAPPPDVIRDDTGQVVGVRLPSGEIHLGGGHTVMDPARQASSGTQGSSEDLVRDDTGQVVGVRLPRGEIHVGGGHTVMGSPGTG